MYKLYSNYVAKNLFIMRFVFFGSVLGFLLTSIFIAEINFNKEIAQQYLTYNNNHKLFFDTDQIFIENGRVSELNMYLNNFSQGKFKLIFNYDPVSLSLLDIRFSNKVKNPIFAKDLVKKAFLLSGEIEDCSNLNKLATILLQPIDNRNSQISLNCLDSDFIGLQSLRLQNCPLKVKILNKKGTIADKYNNCSISRINPPKIIYANSGQNGDGIDLAWEKESADQSVSIFYKQLGESDWSVVPNIKFQNNYYIDGLNSEKSYLIKIFSSNNCIQSRFSDTYLVALGKAKNSTIFKGNVTKTNSDLRKDLFYKIVRKIAYFSRLNKLVYVLIFLILGFGWFSVWLMNDFLKNINNIDTSDKY